MSSNSYSACLAPDPWLRIVVSISGRLLIAAGLALLLVLAIDELLKAVSCIVWILIGRFELRRLEGGFETCRAIRIESSGDAMILNSEENWVPARLLTGSVLLRRLAWIRLQDQSGRIFLELISGDARQSQNWRRLQVIWRHIGA